VNAATRDGWTPLMGAAEKGRTEVARELLSKGAHAGDANHERKTALAYAEKGEHTAVIALLKEPGK
jgi:ankyrin repeat protein